MVYIVMGVSGCGKTTVGKLLAAKLGIMFYDADDFHSASNLNKMKSCIPLDDNDRMPWLMSLADNISNWNKQQGAVLACSALKEKYRKILSSDGQEEVRYIYLKGDKNLILERLKNRKEHFFPAELLDSQFSSLDAPDNSLVIEINNSPENICNEILPNLKPFKRS